MTNVINSESNEKQSTVLPHFKIVVMDETEYWSADFKERAGKIFRAYLFDSTRHVHCCEVTPSYELYPLYSTPLKGDDDEGNFSAEINTEEAKNGFDVRYYHVRVIDGMPEDHIHDLGVETVMPESYQELLDFYLEDAQANVKIQIPASAERELESA